jgi:predicted alpha-1,6-mannanase (GH76 family)
MWMVIACARAFLLSGNSEFLDAARTNFDLCYARAASPDLGGGLWWKVDNRSKNACVNGPGAIAAYLLGQSTGEADYFTKARDLFLWERSTLFDPATGQVYDNINIRGRVARFALTYNQGDLRRRGKSAPVCRRGATGGDLCNESTVQGRVLARRRREG